jgi:hypothetical protein
MQKEHKADCSPVSNAEVESVMTVASTTQIHLHNVKFRQGGTGICYRSSKSNTLSFPALRPTDAC